MKKIYYTSFYLCSLELMFVYICALGIYLMTLKMTLNPPKNTINGFSGQNPMTKEELRMFLELLVKNDIFAHFTLKLTFRPWTWPWINYFRNGFPSQNHMKMRYYTCFLFNLLKNHIWSWNWPLTLNLQKRSNFLSWHSSHLNSAERNL